MESNKVREFINGNFGEVRTTILDDKIWFMANDCLKILEYSESGWRTKISRLAKKGDVIKCKVPTNGGIQSMSFINERTLKSLIISSTNITKYRKNQILDSFGFCLDNNFITELKNRDEIEFIEKLKNALIPFGINGESQAKVLDYYIDYYIPSLNIAIEYDENNHSNYTYEQHKGRQVKIEKKLGCRFIRVSDKNTHEYNIGYIIKELLLKILNISNIDSVGIVSQKRS